MAARAEHVDLLQEEGPMSVEFVRSELTKVTHGLKVYMKTTSNSWHQTGRILKKLRILIEGQRRRQMSLMPTGLFSRKRAIFGLSSKLPAIPILPILQRNAFGLLFLVSNSFPSYVQMLEIIDSLHQEHLYQMIHCC